MSNDKGKSVKPEASKVDGNKVNSKDVRIPNPTIIDYCENDMNEMKHRGHADEHKVNKNMRTIAMNMHGCRPEQTERLKDIKGAMGKHQMDVALFNEANAKWNAMNVSRVEKVMKKMEKGIQTHTSDSKQWKATKNSYLPGGLLTLLRVDTHPLQMIRK